MTAALDLCVAYGGTPTVKLVSDTGLVFGQSDAPQTPLSIIVPEGPLSTGIETTGPFESLLPSDVTSLGVTTWKAGAFIHGKAHFSAKTDPNSPEIPGKTVYSFPKTLFLRGTKDSLLSVVNRRLILIDPLPVGIALLAKASSVYEAPGTGTNTLITENIAVAGAVPDGWSVVSTDYFVIWDSSAAKIVKNVQNGAYLRLILAVSSEFTGGTDKTFPLPSILFDWDEV